MTAAVSPGNAGRANDAAPTATIAIVTGGIPHYRWPFFEELANRGAAIHVLAAGRLPDGILATPSPDPRIAVVPLARRVPGWRSDVVAALHRISPNVILLEHGASLDYAWTTLLARRVRAPVVVWTHGIARQELYGRQRGLASWGRWAQLSRADGIVCYDAQMADEMRTRFARKIVGVAPNSTDGTLIVKERTRCEHEGQAAVRRRLGLSARFYLAGLGRLVPDKDFRRLLRVVGALRRGGRS